MKNIFVCICLCIALVGCGNVKPDANYVAYTQAIQQQATLEQGRIDAVSLAAQACNSDARCVEHVAALAAIAAVSGSGHQTQPEQFRERPSFLSQAGLALIGQIAPLAGAAVAWHQSDTSAKVQIAQTSYLDHVLTSAVSGIAGVATNATPSITVGGNYGDTHTGDTVGRDQIGRDNVGRDNVAGNSVRNSGNLGNDNRQGSPGPIGPVCTGDACQPVQSPINPDPPVDGGDGGG